MIEEWTPYLKEDDLHLIHDFIEKDILKHRLFISLFNLNKNI